MRRFSSEGQRAEYGKGCPSWWRVGKRVVGVREDTEMDKKGRKAQHWAGGCMLMERDVLVFAVSKLSSLHHV